MSFFDAEPPDQPPRVEPDYRPPEWAQAPDNVAPAAVVLDALLFREPGRAAWVAAAQVYSTGLAFELVIVHRDRMPVGRHRMMLLPGEPGGPRFGIAFADGRRATTDRAVRAHDERPEIVVRSSGGGGSDRRWSGRMWLWPLPPPGPMTLAFAWPGEDGGEGTVQIDTAPIREAASRAIELWADERPERPPRGDGDGWTAYAGGV